MIGRAGSMGVEKPMRREGDSQHKIFLFVFSTSEGVFERFKVNATPFIVYDPKTMMRPIFRELLRELGDLGVHAYPHENMLYMIFRVRGRMIISSLRGALDSFAKKYQRTVSYTLNNFRINELSPASNPSHFTVVRSLLYSYFRSMFYRSGAYIPLSHRRTREGLRITIPDFCENISDIYSGEYTYRICHGLKFLFEVTPRHRGHLWIDVFTEVLEENLSGRLRSLSHHEIKHIDVKLYKRYSEKARMNPRERAKLVEGLLLNLLRTFNVKDSIEVKYYIYDANTNNFNEERIVFKRLHYEP
jgi:hypothetical protein